MPDSGWTLHDTTAELSTGSWRGLLSLARSSAGLTCLTFEKAFHPSATILAVQVAPESHTGDVPVEAYVRGNDLVANYPATGAREVAIQAYWRLAPWRDPAALVVDLQVSVNTQQWETCPEQLVTSWLAPYHAYRVPNVPGELIALGWPASDGAVALDSETYCVLWRPNRGGFSYVEMTHPDDSAVNCLERRTLGRQPRDEHEPEAHLWLNSHRLFSSHLEKGVILRSRLRGAWVPRAGDEQAAADLYADLLSAPLPLTT
ncbi:MAG: hypothetical protein JSS27_21000 [Planctomycetes bacterium]|nr:hypothetical protein [Planctomycetota bacterium]